MFFFNILSGCNKIYEDAINSRELSLKLSQNILRTLDLFKEMCTTYTNVSKMYNFLYLT